MSLFDKYVQLSSLDNQGKIIRQNNSMIDALQRQNTVNLYQTLAIQGVQREMDRANRIQEKHLAEQKQAAEHQKFLKDAVFTSNQILDDIQQIADPVARLAVLLAAYGDIRNLLKGATDQLHEIQDKVAASTLTKKLDSMQQELMQYEKEFHTSKIGKFLNAKQAFDGEAAPVFEVIQKNTPKPPQFPRDQQKYIRHLDRGKVSFYKETSQRHLEILSDFLNELNTKVKKWKKTFWLLALPVVVVIDLILFRAGVIPRHGLADDIGSAIGVGSVLLSIPAIGIIVFAIYKLSQIKSTSESIQVYCEKLKAYQATLAEHSSEIQNAQNTLAEIGQKYDVEKVTAAMVKQYPQIFEQLQAPLKTLDQLYVKWGRA